MNIKLLILGTIALTGVALLFASQPSKRTLHADEGLTVEAFSSFRKTNNKVYGSIQELQYRHSVFAKNLAMINKHNADTTRTYKLGINSFSDLTFAEFKAKYLGHSSDLQGDAKCEKTGNDSMVYGDEQEVDWVKKGVVHEPKNQARCGSCWAFSTNGALEAAFAIFKNEKDLDLSEQELVDCSKENNGCGGGLMSLAYDYILEKGIHDSKDYKYTGVEADCKAEDIKGTIHKITGCRQVPKGVKNIVTALQKQPIAVAFHVQEDFYQYSSGVYNPEDCTDAPNHGVTAVGFNLNDKIPYLLIKNSWGKEWGLKGYFQMAIGSDNGTCQIGGHEFNYYPLV